ncbi:MAG: hypothetical protein ACXVCP_08045 [Bdellovibrio sp.]
MKNLNYLFLVIVVLLLIGKIKNSELATNSSRNHSKISQDNNKAFMLPLSGNYTKAPSIEDKVGQGVSLEKLLESKSQGPIFSFLFAPEFKKHWQQNKKAILEAFRERLSKPMPEQKEPHDTSFQNELRLRIALVQSLVKLQDSEIQPLFSEVLKSENQHWLLKWLSLRSLQQMKNIDNKEQYFSDLYKELDPRIINLSKYSEEDILDRLTSNAN